MRIIKIIFISLIGLLVIFLTIGAVFPSFEYTNQITIDAKREKCWEWLNNPTAIGKWNTGVESYELIDGEHLKTGGTYKLVIVEGEEKMEMTQKIVDINSPSTIHYILTNDVLVSDFAYSLEEQNNETTLTAHYSIKGNSILWSSILRLSKGYIAGEGQQQLEKLKKLIESNL